jgi:hypothetical protein
MYPNLLADKEEKETKEFGLQFFNAFWAEFNRGGFFEQRRIKFRELRNWAEGVQSVQNIIDRVGSTDETLADNTSYLNLDYTPISIIPVYVDGMIGNLLGNGYKCSVDAIDKISKSKKLEWIEKEINRIKFAKILNQAEQITGIPVEKSKFISEEEAQLYYDTELKLPIEIAMELTCADTLNESDKDELEKRIIQDLVTIKFAATKVIYDENYKTKVRYVDPEYLVTSKTMKPDHSDINIAGEVIYMSISDLGVDSGFSKKELYDIATIFTGRFGNPANLLPYQDNMADNSWLNNLVPVLDAEFLSTDKEVYTTFENSYGKKRIKRGAPKDERDSAKYTNIVNKYVGKWVIDTKYIYNYGLAENMIFPTKNGVPLGQTRLSYKIYAPNYRDGINKSHVERMVPYAEQMHLAHIKIQQFLSKAKPPGLAINVNGFEGINLGKGTNNGIFNPLSVEVHYEQTGNYYYSNKDEMGNSINGRAVQPALNPIGELEKLILTYNFNQQILKQMIGDPLNAISANPEQGLGMTQLANEATQKTLIPLRMAFQHIWVNTCSDIIEMAKSKALSKEGAAIGDFNAKLLEMTKELSTCELGMKVEWKPDLYEKSIMQAALNSEVVRGSLRSEDSIFIQSFDNAKQQMFYMKVKRKEYEDEKNRIAKVNIETQSIANGEAAKVAEQARALADMQILKAKEDLVWTEAFAKVYVENQKATMALTSEQEAHVNKLAELALQEQFKKLQPSPTNA